MSAINTLAYRCEGCDNLVPVATPFQADKPAGYFINLRRVTAARNHSITEELYLCTKDCMIEYMQHGISASTTPFRPIGVEEKR